MNSLPKEEEVVLLHRRLGHPSFTLLKTMYPRLFKELFVDELMYDACQLAKSKKKIYPSVDSISQVPFHLIHYDVWGPSLHTDINGFRWFLVCVDDHSRFCWLYLMKHKTEVIKILKNICQLIKRQFEINIQGFKTDNDKDFCNRELLEFFEHKGIRHETSCPYTPQQNGLAKRKIEDLMNKCRALIEQAHLPKNLWGFAEMTIVHLINRLATKNLNLNNPIEVLGKLFPKARLKNGLIPRVFGCACYVHTPRLSPHKLSVKALKCVFVGYSNTQKGDKCYHPLTKRVIIAKDIVFNEQCFYYQTNIEPNKERDGIEGEFHTPLPFPSMQDQQETQLPQENQESTTKLDSQLATNGNTQPSTYPK